MLCVDTEYLLGLYSNVFKVVHDSRLNLTLPTWPDDGWDYFGQMAQRAIGR